jgi:hypothetical protein
MHSAHVRLWLMSGERSLSATGKPTRSAAEAACSAVSAVSDAMTGIP